MDSEKVIKRDNEYVLHTYNRNPIALEKGHGLYAEGPEGQKYLDFTSGIGVNSLGYCDLTWAEAVSEQAHKLQHTSNLYYTAPCGKLAKKLCKRTGMSKVFFGNSGAEANEGAIKCARKYSVDTYGEGRNKVITLVNSFHGRTLATLTATGQDVFHHDFGPFPGNFDYVPAGDFAALEKAADKDTCAVMMELVQGDFEQQLAEAGIMPTVRRPSLEELEQELKRGHPVLVLISTWRLTGDKRYFDTAKRAMKHALDRRSKIGLMAANIDARRHWCFKAASRAEVDAFHAAGLAHGGADDGAPGLRPHYHAHYYGAFLLDPFGNRIEAVCHRTA